MRRLNYFSALSESAIRDINEASLRLLEQTGVGVLSERVLKFLSENGVDVDFSAKRARFPRAMVEDCISRLPGEITLCDRSGRPAVTLGKRRTVVASGHNATFVLDMDTGKRRPATARDVGAFARLTDALETKLVAPATTTESAPTSC